MQQRMPRDKIDADIKEKLIPILGKELKYKDLCAELDIPYKNGASKRRQLEDLSLYCDLEVLDNPTRYVVNKVYDGAIIAQINGNNKFQDLFEGAMYQALLNNNGEPLHISNMEMLRLFNEVNENFSYACNKSYMSLLGGDYLTLNEMSQITYKILRQWTKRRMEQMEARRVIITRKGFRLYRKWEDAYIIQDVLTDSETEQICQMIYDRAAKETLPEDWHGEWVQSYRWENFEKRIAELTEEFFDGEYINLKPITIISPPKEDYLREILGDIYNKIPELQEINQEARNKIFSTSQLDKYTGADRKMLVDISIKENPSISLKNKIKQRNRED